MGILLDQRPLNFNDELPALESELWDYVIFHELLHFLSLITASSGKA